MLTLLDGFFPFFSSKLIVLLLSLLLKRMTLGRPPPLLQAYILRVVWYVRTKPALHISSQALIEKTRQSPVDMLATPSNLDD